MKKPGLVIGLLTCALVSCSDPETPTPLAPSPSQVSSIELAGPASIAPGQSAQLTATLYFNDGTSRPAAPSDGVSWFSSNNSIVAVSPTGLATTTPQKGEA